MEATGLTALDTNIFIYALEGNPEFGSRSAELLRSAQNNGVASTIVYLEILSSSVFQNIKHRETALNFLDEQQLVYVEALKDVLVLAAELRAGSPTKLELGDAVHLASALRAGADTFITNDQDLVKVKVEGLEIVSL